MITINTHRVDHRGEIGSAHAPNHVSIRGLQAEKEISGHTVHAGPNAHFIRCKKLLENQGGILELGWYIRTRVVH
jgi:hypothetical protein